MRRVILNRRRMNKFRIIIATTLIVISAILLPISLSARRNLTPEQDAQARGCDNRLVGCWNNCAKRYSSKPGPFRACEHDCETSWQLCLESHGIWVAQQKPRKPIASTETAGVERPTPTPRPSATVPGDRDTTGNRNTPQKPKTSPTPTPRKR